jgi:hypothetical protein
LSSLLCLQNKKASALEAFCSILDTPVTNLTRKYQKLS